MTNEEINNMFPPEQHGNAQISDLRLALNKLAKDGNIGGPGSGGDLKSDGSVPMENGYVPSKSQDISTKQYVDDNVGSGGGDGQLVLINDGRTTGWILKGQETRPGRSAIGTNAVDMVTGPSAYASGYPTGASGPYSHAEGKGTHASGSYSHAEGYGYYSTVVASGEGSHAEGIDTIASGDFGAHAEGYATVASGDASHAEGSNTIAPNMYMHASGTYNAGNKGTIYEVGIGTDGNRKNAFEVHIDGNILAPELNLNASSDGKTLTTKEYVDANAGGVSQLEKIVVDAKGAVGYRILGRDPNNYGDLGSEAIDLSYSNSPGTTFGAAGNNSFAVGYQVEASGGYSYAEGYRTIASGSISHAEGKNTTAGYMSHAEGYGSQADGYYSAHAEGYYTQATGDYGAHAEGRNTIASGASAHAEGYYTTARNLGSHAAGKYNVGTATDTIHETGIGTGSSNKKNAFEIYTDGTLTAPEATPALVDARGQQALVPISYLFSAEFGNSIPTADPLVAGVIWNNAGVLTVSAG